MRDSWGRFNRYYHTMLAQEGYLVWICDNRTASGKGLESVKGIYRNLGALRSWRTWRTGWTGWSAAGLGRRRSASRLWGWSYGGYMTSYALTHSERFKIGIVGAPVTDWHLYDTIYTERFMDTPPVQPRGLRAQLRRCWRRPAKASRAHADPDPRRHRRERAHAELPACWPSALQDAGIQFDLMIYPGNRHGIDQARPAPPPLRR